MAWSPSKASKLMPEGLSHRFWFLFLKRKQNQQIPMLCYAMTKNWTKKLEHNHMPKNTTQTHNTTVRSTPKRLSTFVRPLKQQQQGNTMARRENTEKNRERNTIVHSNPSATYPQKTKTTLHGLKPEGSAKSSARSSDSPFVLPKK